MDNELTEVVFILDKSGSMSDLTEDTIGGFNSMLEKQKKEPGRCLVSTVLFNGYSTVIHDRIPIEHVPEMTRNDYCATGSTALLDAMGRAIHHISNVHRYIREEDRPSKTVFVITTDGMENSSRRYCLNEVEHMVRAKKHEGWEFIFLGANFDAIETARTFGIDEDRAVTFHNDSEGVNLNYSVVSECVARIRCKKDIGDWKRDIDSYRRKKEGGNR